MGAIISHAGAGVQCRFDCHEAGVMSDTYRRIDPASVDFSAARHARKTGWVAARPAKEGERIATRMKDGHVETTNVATALDMVVTNPGGERYLLRAQKFAELYAATGTAGMFQPRGAPVPVVPVTENVEFIAPWGQLMRIKAGGVLACKGPGDVEGIQPDEFAGTYEWVE